MTEVLRHVPVAGAQIVAGIVEHRHISSHAPCRFAGPFHIIGKDQITESLSVSFASGIETLFFHIFHTPGAAALVLADDVKKHPVGIGKKLCGFFDQTAEVVHVGGIEAEGAEAGLHGGGLPAHITAFEIQFPPAGFQLGNSVVDACRDIDGHPDVDLVAGIHLCPEQIEVQSGVHFAHLCGVITVSVMTAGKTGDGVHMGGLQSLLPQFFVKTFPDPGNERGGMKVKVDLTEIQFISVHNAFSFLKDVFSQILYHFKGNFSSG
jgi:hypothetical protein